MNIDKLIDKYFTGEASNVAIEVFDDTNIYAVYSDIVKMLHDYPEIELSILQLWHIVSMRFLTMC